LEKILPFLDAKSQKLYISLLTASILAASQPSGNFATFIQALDTVVLCFLLLLAVEFCFASWQNPSCSHSRRLPANLLVL